MDNCYNKKLTTNRDKNDKSLNATGLAVFPLRDAPGTGMVIPAWKSSNGPFLLLRACWGTLREPLHVFCGN